MIIHHVSGSESVDWEEMCITDSNVFIEINDYSHKMHMPNDRVCLSDAWENSFKKNQDLHKVLGNLTMVLVGLLYPKYPQYHLDICTKFSLSVTRAVDIFSVISTYSSTSTISATPSTSAFAQSSRWPWHGRWVNSLQALELVDVTAREIPSVISPNSFSPS